jgi:hypothetical protein
MIYLFQTKAQTILRFHPGEMIHISILHLFLIHLILAIVLAFSHKWSSNQIIPSPLLLQNNENLLSRLWSAAWTQWEVVVKLCVESEVAMHKDEVVVKVGAESKVAMSENGSGGQSGCRIQSGHEWKWKWWSKGVQNQKWPCVKMEVVVKVGA